MREIKFRAWDKEYKKMLYQDQFKCNNKLMKYHDQIKWFFWHLYNIPIGHKGYSDPMQYTGLKDKHGKEIYEGDIVKDIKKVRTGTRVARRRRDFDTFAINEDRECFGIVEFNKIKYQIKWNVYDEYLSYFFVSSLRKDKPKKRKDQIITDLYNNVEIIGNIYESPELLK